MYHHFSFVHPSGHVHLCPSQPTPLFPMVLSACAPSVTGLDMGAWLGIDWSPSQPAIECVCLIASGQEWPEHPSVQVSAKNHTRGHTLHSCNNLSQLHVTFCLERDFLDKGLEAPYRPFTRFLSSQLSAKVHLVRLTCSCVWFLLTRTSWQDS